VFLQTDNEIPVNSLEVTLPRLLLGVSRTFHFNEKFSLLSEVDFDMTFDGKRNTLIRGNTVSVDPHMGIEFGYGGFVFLRGGLGNIQQISEVTGSQVWTLQPNMGIGIKIKGLSLDYALTDIGDKSVALYSNVFSLKFNIFKKVI
jgi:hypothetical protein